MSSNVRRRRRTVEERLGAAVRHLRPGDLAGRSEPLPRDGGGATRVSGGPAGDGDRGVHIEHVTLQATASQTIASGGAGVEFDRIAGPPTERRGFETLSARIATGGVVAIPIDVRGVLKYILDGRWSSWQSTGSLTVTKRGLEADETRVYDLARTVATREFDGEDDGFEVEPGERMIYTLSNPSGADQTLAEATLVQLIRVLTTSTTPPDRTQVWVDSAVHDTSNPATTEFSLVNGGTYEVTVVGNSRDHGTVANYDGGSPDEIMFESDSPASTGQAGFDYECQYAWPTVAESSGGHRPTYGHGEIQFNLGSGWSHHEPVGGPFSTPASGHEYTIEVTGQGVPLQIGQTEIGDDNGKYLFTVRRTG